MVKVEMLAYFKSLSVYIVVCLTSFLGLFVFVKIGEFSRTHCVCPRRLAGLLDDELNYKI